MQVLQPFKLIAFVLLLATSDIWAQSSSSSGTKEASGAINELKGLLLNSASTTPPANVGNTGTGVGNTGTGTGTGGTGTGTGGTGTGTGGTGTGTGGTGTGTGGTGTGTGGTGTGTGGTGTGTGGTGTGTGGTGTGTGGTGTGTGGTGTGTGTGGTGTGTGTGGTGTGTGTGGTGTGTGTGGTGTGTGTGGTGTGTGGTGTGTGGTGTGTGGTGTGTGTGGTGTGTGGTGTGTGGSNTGTGGTGTGTGNTGTGGNNTGIGGTGTGTGGTGTGTGGTGTGTGGTGTGTGGTGNTGTGITVSGGTNTSGNTTTTSTAGGGAITMYKTGWNKDRVMAYAKGSRPNPSTYLTEAYINDHLNRFKREGGSFMIVESWLEKGAFNAFALRKFVMLRSDMDKVMAKYYQTGRIEDIEDALGYRRGDLKGLAAEIHVINIDSVKYKFELPNGNEIGANDLWEPGAKTSGGYREAIIIDKTDPAKTIVHNKNPEALHTFDFKELIYKQGWYNRRVRDIPKPTRPNPADYLIATYIQNHLQKFNAEGGAFMVVKRWIENPAENYMAFPLKKFVMLKSDMDAVVAKFQQSGEISDIEDALGYTKGTLAGLEDDLYVFYLDKTKFIFELPTGNEIGANNLWEPEARTSGGFLECVVTDKTNPNNPITHNKLITTLQSKFQYIKVAGEGSNAIYKPGWSKSRVMAIPKGSRPNPSTYLTASYITNHLNLFKAEGGAFMIVEPWIKSSPFPSFPLRKFVMLRSDMDRVMAKYYQSGRIEDIEDALGYKRGDLKGKDADIHIIYLDPSKYNFELPNGNEIGANELWEPGAKTSGGYREAVIIDKSDPAKTIAHNKNPEVLHNFDFKELIYKQGWYNKRVRDIPKLTRPNPSDYLIPTYIQNHLQKFNTEGGAFMVVKRWIENPAENYMAFPLKKFVMLKSDMDKVVAKFQQTGDVKDIEDALGYTTGTLTGLEDDLYVFYLNKTKYLFELPTGNEIGANSLWEPEAHTSGGFLECVVTDKADPNRPITHNKQIATLQSAFQNIKVAGAGSASIYLPGWSKSRVMAIPKGSRPNPSTYLTASYVTDHLNLFKTEGGAFMIVEPWIETSPFPSFPLRKFVMLRSDMDKVMDKYYQSGRIEDIEDALGYKRGDLKGKDADIHVIYLDPSKYNFELPNGNEIGANELWEPGAKTSGGYREAVIIDKSDPAKTIVHNKDPEALHTFDFKELIYKQGWYNKRVKEIPKPTRPNPADYLIPSYIQNHLQKFDTEGGAFMVVKRWIEDPTQNYMAFPLKKFVMLKSDMDAVVAKFQQSGDVKDIEDALGYTTGTLTGLEDDLYVFYLDKSKYIFELPTGNEIGANNLWEPEAHTSGGFLECVVTDKADPNRPITHNKQIATLQSAFQNIKVAGAGSTSIYQAGWSKSRVIAIPKGSRPNPSTYLTASYITEHLNLFKAEGGAFMIVEPWIETSPFPSFPLRKFVMLRSDMDKVMDKYYQSGRIEDIEDALGYKRGDLKGKDADIHVIYLNPSQYNFELPNGNEIGANELWEPGAKTSGGYREAVIIDKSDPAKTIVHNKDPEALHTFDFKELIYKQGWYNKRVKEIPKPTRPNPADYLIPSYIQNHLQKFDTEGGAFMVVKRWIEDPTQNYMAFPLKKFVMLKSDMDAVVAKFQQSGDVKDIEDALGYTTGTLTGLEDDLYVFYLDKSKYIFELPTGNEIGANNLWEPEAHTSGGFLECVVTDKTDPNKPITHNKTIPFLQSQFTNIKVKQ